MHSFCWVLDARCVTWGETLCKPSRRTSTGEAELEDQVSSQETRNAERGLSLENNIGSSLNSRVIGQSGKEGSWVYLA